MRDCIVNFFTDTANSKYSNRRNGKIVAVQLQRAEASRNIGLKKNSNNCKQPQPRASLFCRKKSSEVCLKSYNLLIDYFYVFYTNCFLSIKFLYIFYSPKNLTFYNYYFVFVFLAYL